jgi:endogenous inhibitor of DNA gyrase (YacG/DUF329 family)
MQQTCPYCGTSMEDSADEIRPGVRLCPTCGQEVKMSGQSDSPPQEPGPVPSPQEAQGSDAAQATPPPPPPPSGAANDLANQSQAGSQTSEQAPSGPTLHTPAWELEGGFWLQKLWRTLWQVLLHPMLTFWAPGRMRQQYPLGFGLILGTLGSVLAVLWDALINSGETAALAPVMTVFIAPVGIIIGLYVGSGIMHLFLMIVGAARGGFTATFRVTGYSYAGYIFMFIPVLGGFVAAVWMMVVQIGGLAATHGVTRWRVVGAILLFLGVLLAIVVAGALLVGCGAFLAQMDIDISKFN